MKKLNLKQSIDKKSNLIPKLKNNLENFSVSWINRKETFRHEILNVYISEWFHNSKRWFGSSEAVLAWEWGAIPVTKNCFTLRNLWAFVRICLFPAKGWIEHQSEIHISYQTEIKIIYFIWIPCNSVCSIWWGICSCLFWKYAETKTC